jgi:hypothetical protein
MSKITPEMMKKAKPCAYEALLKNGTYVVYPAVKFPKIKDKVLLYNIDNTLTECDSVENAVKTAERILNARNTNS